MHVCGSISSWTGNPSFCVFEVDKDSLLPLERITYAFDLEKANQDEQIQWVKYTEYSIDYNMTDLSPSQFKNVAQNILNDSTQATLFNTKKIR